MRLVFFGDLVGRCGREAFMQRLPEIQKRLTPDAIIVNGENAAGGFGITPDIAKQLFEAGVTVITTGNHVWDQKALIPHLAVEPRIIRPLNYPPRTPGNGAYLATLAGGRQLLVVQVMGRVFMDALDDPFQSLEAELGRYRLGASVAAILVEVHGEASSEKMAIGHFLDGRVSAVVGTHTHIPTADAQILPKGTAYQSDAGMCGDYDSVIGMKKELSLARFIRKMPGEKMTPAEGEATVCGIVIDLDEQSGLAKAIRPLRLGGRLSQTEL